MTITLAITPPTATAQQKGLCVCEGRVRAYTKPRQKAIDRTYWALLYNHRPRVVMEGAVAVSVRFYYPANESQKRMHKKLGLEVLPKVTKPDVDNVAKALVDAMTRAGFWRDDSQVARLVLEKYTTIREPKIEVEYADF